MSNGHGIIVCEGCGTVMRSCRCMEPHERIPQGYCQACGGLHKGAKPEVTPAGGGRECWVWWGPMGPTNTQQYKPKEWDNPHWVRMVESPALAQSPDAGRVEAAPCPGIVTKDLASWTCTYNQAGKCLTCGGQRPTAPSVSATPPPTSASVSYSKIPNNSQAPAPEIEGLRSAMLKIQSAPAITEIKKGHTYYCRNGLKWGTPITDGRRENTERIWDLVLEIPGIEVDIHPHPREQPAAPDTQEARQAAIMRVYEAAMDWADTSPVDKDFDAVCEALWNAVEESQGGQPAAQEGEP